MNVLARYQEKIGAFEDGGLGIASAPVRLGHIPAAFYKVVSKDFDAEAVHVPEDEEILVVLDGVLSVIDDRKFWYGRDEYDFALISGQVTRLRPHIYHMTQKEAKRIYCKARLSS